MRLPQPLLDSPFFLFEKLAELERALGEYSDPELIGEVRRLESLGLPPIASGSALATMIGINPGLVWSFVNRNRKHYRTFYIPKGSSFRRIDAPRVALKVVQKWLATQFGKIYQAPDHVYGFVPNRSHIDAAKVHVQSQWVLSVDIENFFPATPQKLVAEVMRAVGYSSSSGDLISQLTCLNGGLAQGAPSSPILSNFCFSDIDVKLSEMAQKYNVRLTRYADDITFSSRAEYPDGLREEALCMFERTPWTISQRKLQLSLAPERRKVHGFVVHGNEPRLTKGYRNRLRAYRHLVATKQLDPDFLKKAMGHLAYGDFVELIKKGVRDNI